MRLKKKKGSIVITWETEFSKRDSENSHIRRVVIPSSQARTRSAKCFKGRVIVHEPLRKWAVKGRRNIWRIGSLYSKGSVKRALAKRRLDVGRAIVAESRDTSTILKMSYMDNGHSLPFLWFYGLINHRIHGNVIRLNTKGEAHWKTDRSSMILRNVKPSATVNWEEIKNINRPFK